MKDARKVSTTVKDAKNMSTTVKDAKKVSTTMRVSLMGFNEDLVKEWNSHDSFVFLLNQNIENDDGEISSHYSVVTVEKAKDGWWGVVTANDAYESLNENIWKETVQFVVKQLGVTNRSNVVFHNPSSRRKHTTSPYKWFAKTNVIHDDGEYDDDYSCGPYCCNFLLDHFRILLDGLTAISFLNTLQNRYAYGQILHDPSSSEPNETTC